MCKENRCIVPAIIALIIGIAIGILFFTGIIAAGLILTPIIFTIALSAISLILLFIGATFATRKEVKECICEYGKCLTIGGVGALLIGIGALTFIASLVAGSIVAAIVIGIGVFFLVLNLLSIIGLILCLIKGNCPRRYEECKYENDYKC